MREIYGNMVKNIATKNHTTFHQIKLISFRFLPRRGIINFFHSSPIWFREIRGTGWIPRNSFRHYFWLWWWSITFHHPSHPFWLIWSWDPLLDWFRKFRTGSYFITFSPNNTSKLNIQVKLVSAGQSGLECVKSHVTSFPCLIYTQQIFSKTIVKMVPCDWLIITLSSS